MRIFYSFLVLIFLSSPALAEKEKFELEPFFKFKWGMTRTEAKKKLVGVSGGNSIFASGLKRGTPADTENIELNFNGRVLQTVRWVSKKSSWIASAQRHDNLVQELVKRYGIPNIKSGLAGPIYNDRPVIALPGKKHCMIPNDSLNCALTVNGWTTDRGTIVLHMYQTRTRDYYLFFAISSPNT